MYSVSGVRAIFALFSAVMSAMLRGLVPLLCSLAVVQAFDIAASFVPELFLNRVDYSLVQVYLHHIPCAALHDRSLEVSMWDKRLDDNAAGNIAASPVSWRLLATLNDFILEDTTFPSFCTCHKYIQLPQDNYELRAVLRFGSSLESLQSSAPSAVGILPSMMDELQIEIVTADDHYATTTWVHPAIETMSTIAREYTGVLLDSLRKAEASSTGRVERARKGYSGRRFQLFMNMLGAMPDTRYLEVGVYNGSSLISMLDNNSLSAVAIDIWNPEDAAATQMKNEVLAAVQQYNRSGSVHVIHSSVWDVTSGQVIQLLGGPVSIYFYDAGHSVSDHFLSLGHFFTSMDETFIFIVDDWNWNIVRKGTLTAMALYPIEVVAKVEITTLVGPVLKAAGRPGSWHNGMVAFVIQKQQ